MGCKGVSCDTDRLCGGKRGVGRVIKNRVYDVSKGLEGSKSTYKNTYYKHNKGNRLKWRVYRKKYSKWYKVEGLKGWCERRGMEYNDYRRIIYGVKVYGEYNDERVRVRKDLG